MTENSQFAAVEGISFLQTRNRPAVSVVVPTHNRSGWLRAALRSVLEQRAVDLEVLVIDDGSTDDTAKAVAGFEDDRVRLLRHERPWGVGASRNHGAEEARGGWLAFIDDDDLWAPQKLARQVQVATERQCVWSYVGSVNIDDASRVIAAVRPPPPNQVVGLIGARNVIPGGGSNVIVHRETFEAVGPFDTRLKNTEDWEMWIRLSRRGIPAWVPEPLLAYRVHSRNASLDIAAIFEGVAAIERRHGVRADLGVLHRWIGESCLRTGQRADAIRHMALAALNGEALHVAEDVMGILKRRVRRQLRMPSALLPRTDEQWIEPAQRWVNELVRGSGGSEGGGRSA